MKFAFRSRHAVVAFAMLTVAGAGSALGCKDDKPVEAAPAPAAVASTMTKAATMPAVSAAVSASARAKAIAKKAPLDKVATSAKKELPSEWEERDHTEKGFSFWVPKGVKESQATKEGVDVYIAQLPAPHDKVGVFVVAFKDPAKKFPEMTAMTEKILKDMDSPTDYKLVKTEEVNDAYQVLTITYKDKDGKANYVQALLALDVTDRYIMMVGTDGDPKPEEETIDTILANFEMYASGKGE